METQKEFDRYWEVSGQEMCRLFLGPAGQRIEVLKSIVHAAFDMGQAVGAAKADMALVETTCKHEVRRVN